MKLDAIQFNTSTTDTPSWTKLVDLIYPKNSIYLSMGTNNPGNSVGGAWTAISTGAVLALTGSNGFATQGHYGGSLKISVKQLPNHSHTLSMRVDPSGFGRISVAGCNNSGYKYDSDLVNATGGGQNYLPYHYSVKGYYRTS